MRPSATESLYKDIDTQEGGYEYSLNAGLCIRPLLLSDLDQVVALEQECFSEEERATPEKLKYRLEVCPELSAGVFLREFQWPQAKSKAADENSNSDSEFEDDQNTVVAKHSTLKSERLVGHIIATKTDSKHVTDASMSVGGHIDNGVTIAIHSVAVHPEFQGRHIGYVMMKDYVQKFFGLCTAEQMSLLAHAEVVPFYKKHGFKDEGKSVSSFGGQTWRALRLPFDTYDDQMEDD